MPRADASVYLKAMDRRRWAFPIVGVAAARTGDDVRFGLAGVAPIPWASGEEDLAAATPLPGTVYKVEIARALVRRALAAIALMAPARPAAVLVPACRVRRARRQRLGGSS